MTIDNDDDLQGLKKSGRLVADILQRMVRAAEPGMTTRELDSIGAAMMDRAGAHSAPALTYDFPGATCISRNEVCAHGIPGDDIIQAGDLINIDVSLELDGYFADTGASFCVPPVTPAIAALCKAGRMALEQSVRQVKTGARFNIIGRTVESVAAKRGFTVIDNLASHGVGRALHEEPREIPTWYDKHDRRRMTEGLVFTIEPFLSTGATQVDELDDGWSLFTPDGTLAVQYEHTLVATRRGPIVVTQLPDAA